MLIFDTNAVHDLDPHGAKADLLRLLTKAGLRISAPWVVLEELTAHKLYDYQRAFDLMRRQHRELSSLEPNLAGAEPPFRGDRFAEYWRDRYSEIFHTIPTSESALKQSVLREAASMKPAKVDRTKKSGSRDVAIWFSILEYMDEHPTENVFFVSSNTSDFGEPAEWPFPLDLDLGDKASRITHLLSFEEVIDKFTQPSEAPADVGEVLAVRLAAPEALGGMRHALWVRHLKKLFASKHTVTPRTLHLRMEPTFTGEIECRNIGSSTWYWSKVSWQLFVLPRGSTDPLVASWDTSILFPKDEEGGISLLRSGRLTVIEPESLSEIMATALATSVAREEERLNEVSEEVSVDDQQDWGDLNRLTAAEARNAKALANRRTAGSAFRYEQRVLQALRRTVIGELEPVGVDAEVDAVIVTRGGFIGVIIKHVSSAYGFQSLFRNSSFPDSLSAFLVITNQKMHVKPVMAIGRPGGVIQWNSRDDDDAIRRAVRVIKSELGEPGA